MKRKRRRNEHCQSNISFNPTIPLLLVQALSPLLNRTSPLMAQLDLFNRNFNVETKIIEKIKI
jgi:hypothetical protein